MDSIGEEILHESYVNSCSIQPHVLQVDPESQVCSLRVMGDSWSYILRFTKLLDVISECS